MFNEDPSQKTQLEFDHEIHGMKPGDQKSENKEPMNVISLNQVYNLAYLINIRSIQRKNGWERKCMRKTIKSIKPQ